MGIKGRRVITVVSVATLTTGILGAVVALRSPGSATDAVSPTPLGAPEEGTRSLAADPSTTAPAAEVDVPVETPAWTDGHTHLLLTTDGAPTVDSPAGSPGADAALADAVRAVAGVTDVRVVAPGTLAVVTSGAAEAVRAVPGISGTVDDVPLALTADAMEPQQWHLANTGAPLPSNPTHAARAGADVGAAPAWAQTRGAGVVVAVIDTGVDTAHPDLVDRIWTNPRENCTNTLDDDGNGLVNDCRGWDFGSRDNNAAPDTGAPSASHGTHVAGLVAASRNTVGAVGVAPEATIMPIKVTDGLGNAGAGQLTAGIRYAVDAGANIINISMGTGFGPTRAQMNVLESALAYAKSKGVLVVTAAGNSGRDMSASDSWPASFARYHDNVLAVGATWNDDTRAAFSNFGLPTGTMVYAPGVAIVSSLPGSTWGTMSGTSMASPITAGVAALVMSARRATGAGNVRALLVGSASAIGGGSRVSAARAFGTLTAPVGTTTTTARATTTTRAPVTTTTTRATTTTTRATTTTTRAPATTTTTRARTTTTRAAGTTTTVRPSVTTTPVPTPVTSGEWRLDSLSVRIANLAGGRPVTISGRFPTTGPVYVWFSATGPVVPATVVANGTQLSIQTPVVASARTTDVTVKFTANGQPVAMTLANAFTFSPIG